MPYSLFIYLFCFLGLATLPMQAQGPCQVQGDAWLEAAMQTKQVDSSIWYLKQAQEIYLQVGCYDQFLRTSYNLSIAYERLKPAQVQAEAANFRQALAYLPKASDTTLWRPKLYYALGRYYFERLIQLDTARWYFDRALGHYARQGHWKDYVQTARTQARLVYQLEDYRAMETYLDQAYAHTQNYLGGDVLQLRAILQLYGVLYYKMGNYVKALERTQEALKLLEGKMKNRADTLGVLDYYNNMSLLYLELGDLYRAEDYTNNAIHLARALDDYYRAAVLRQSVAEAYQNRGQWQRAFGAYEEALDWLKQARLKALRREEVLDELGFVLNNGLAQAALHLGYGDLVELHLRQNLAKAGALPRFTLAETRRIYAEWYLSKGVFDLAREDLQQALSLCLDLYGPRHPAVAKIYLLLGELEWTYGNTTQALAWYLSADEALRPLAEDYQRISDQVIYLRLVERKIQLLKSKPLTYRRAYQTALEALDWTEHRRSTYQSEDAKLFFQQRILPLYELGIEMALRLHREEGKPETEYLDQAFALLERSKALLLLDALKTEQARAFGNVPQEVLAEERQLSAALLRLERQMAEIKTVEQRQELEQRRLQLGNEAVRLRQELERTYPKYYQLKYADKTVSLAQLQAFLPANTLVLAFFAGLEHYYVFAIAKTEVKVLALERSKLRDMALTSLQTLINTPQHLQTDGALVYEVFTRLAHDIYQTYLAEFLSDKAQIQRLVILPDGLFNYLPFEVLLFEPAPSLEGGAELDFRPLAYLLKRYTISYHYSASLLLYAGQQEGGSATKGLILGFAPSYDLDSQVLAQDKDSYQRLIRQKVKNLPGAHQEVAFLKETYRGDYFFDEQASEHRFKTLATTSDYSVLHLAMHGWVDAQQPALSNLVFTYQADSSAEEDNLLHAYELNLLNLQADLVVLSACETGFGKYERGEGVVSLGRGFMYAGVPSLLMTLWPINDLATAYLMMSFYQGLYQGQDKDQALRQAKLTYLQAAGPLTSHPFFWASFIALGDQQPLALGRRNFDLKNITLSILLCLSLAGLCYLWWDNRKQPYNVSNPYD